MRPRVLPTIIIVTTILAITGSAAPAQEKKPDAAVSIALPFDELKKLLGAADAPKDVPAPENVLFGPAVYTLDVVDKQATLTVEIDLTLPNPRWVLVPLGSGRGATEVTFDGKPAALVRRNETVSVLIDARNANAGKLRMTAQAPVTTQGGVTGVTLPLIPAAPMAQLKGKINAPNVVVKVPGAAAVKIDGAAPATTFTASALPQADSIAVQWAARDARPARVTAQHTAHIAIDRGVIRYAVAIEYDIARSPVESVKLQLPEGVDVKRLAGDMVADVSAIDENAKPRVFTLQLKEPVQGTLRVLAEYEQRLSEKDLSPALALPTALDVSAEQGFVGIEIRGNYDVTPDAKGADRIDVAQLPESLWRAARSPLRFGFRFDKFNPALSVALRPLQDLDVLVAMSDYSEVATTVTPEGKVITKMIMIVRNNQKAHLRVSLPKDATLWSAFVDDRPVTPAKDEKGDVLIPLRKSQAVNDQEEDNYINKRDNRRKQGNFGNVQQQAMAQLDQLKSASGLSVDDDVSDLKPYDVELVFVQPSVALDQQRGVLKLALPKVDLPIGQLAWGVILPTNLRVVQASGSMREVDGFTLPFQHFAEQGRQQELARAEQKMQQAAKALEKAAAEVPAGAKARGVLPVRIEIPLTGSLYRFEKLLTVDEEPTVEMEYVKRQR